ncbi:hypothetical protein ACFFX1_34060 [Dactylosporangium sucinum]|uniref:Uncharacterized protein n=1 Tax=Dactylosporangium sucinum TaxID=1424081 RepID=A0A917UFC0_9ACTN|nr:hypothetical protein [Dactylosporangium sucinum]GGM88810.1 hypothetical protein GCM10007977_108530 [Dactylosporangium sucinum]
MSGADDRVPDWLPRALSRDWRALFFLPRKHPRHLDTTAGLMGDLRALYLARGDVTLLDEGINRGCRELKRAGSRTSVPPDFHAGLAGLLQARYQHGGDPADIEEALRHIRTALERAGTVAPEQSPKLMCNLAFTLRSRFEAAGDFADLSEALDLARRAHQEAPPTLRPKTAYMLSTILAVRFTKLGESADLVEARLLAADVVAQLPDDHPELAAYVAHLAAVEMNVYRRTGDPHAREQAGLHHERLLDRLDTVEAIRPVVVANWSLMLEADIDYLDPAQWLQPGGPSTEREPYVRLARRMLPELQAAARQAEGTAYWSHAMVAVARTYLSIYAAGRRDDDLRSAVAAAAVAVRSTPPDEPDHADARMVAAAVRLASAVRHDTLSDVTAVESHLAAVVHHRLARPAMRVRAARFLTSVRMALQDPAGALAVSRLALDLLPLLVWPGTSRPDREFRLALAADVGRDAAAAALSQGRLADAVEVNEAGRAVLWSGVLSMRADLAGVAAAAPELARELTRVRLALAEDAYVAR